MRKATFASLVFVVCGSAATAQLTLTPKAGIENSITCLDGSRSASSVAPQVAVRANYLFRNVHGPFAGVATNRSQVGYSYVDPNSGYHLTNTTTSKMQLRLEAGYMMSTKPIALGKTTPASGTEKRCGYYSRCGQARQAAQTASNKLANYNVRIQPFAGMAFVPNPQTSLTNESNGDVYRFNRGTWNSAVIGGANFEVAKGSVRKFVVGVQYLGGLGRMDSETIIANKESVTTAAAVKSKMSAWNFTVGIPLALTKAKKVVAKPAPVVTPKPEVKKSCSSYRSRCGNWQ